MLEAISGQLLTFAGVCVGVCAVYYFGRYLANLETSFVGKKLSDYSNREESSWLEMAGQKYSVALANFAASPLDEHALNRVLKCGRHYSQICSEQGNNQLFNESALEKDIAAARESCNLLNASIQ
jgi:hypothetical protein